MPLHLRDRWTAYLEPLEPLLYAYMYLLQNLRQGPFGLLGRTFATWYLSLGHHFAAFEDAHTPVPRLMAMASGTVLELGPGSGNQLPRYKPASISRIYGIEPNQELYSQLHLKVAESNLTEIYVPINSYLEDDKSLRSYGITPNSVDTIVCMQVLCSVSDLAAASRQIHRLLKPGGQLLFWEHTASNDFMTRWVQRFWNVFRTPVIGHCSLSRDVETTLIRAGDWDVAEVGFDSEKPWALMPRYWGRFVKK